MSIVVEGLYHTYNPHTPLEVSALEDINLKIEDGEFIGIIGPTGSGKSTLIQHFNGLLLPTKGRVVVDGIEVGKKGTNLREIRRRVGLVFQYPEHQLFEETVYKDVAFGPKNLGLDDEEVALRVREAMRLVGLDESFLDRSPFELSGGQMRRVAMAGILAMNPGTLVLDEPTAGLDPRGRDAVLGYIKELHAKKGTTIILVSHNMGEIARLAERIYVMDRGRVVLTGSPREVFMEEDLLRE
ncbi:MAG TPA: energy-coupling factor transporter ATPase, partial [Clostridia bacterium]|nr:energy-coupling factor transporter ATPase [Clostridia bacterium]